MGGFTQPRHLAFLNTLDPTRKEKDSYALRVGDDRVRPAEEAYEPHCVYLVATRHPVRWGHGRATRRECLSGFCKVSELPQRLKELNYGRWRSEGVKLEKVPGMASKRVTVSAGWDCDKATKELLDLTVWPGSPEERSLLNKPAWRARRNLQKELKTAADAQDLPPLLPAVDPSWTRPAPPYLDPPAVVPLFTVTLPTRPLAATLARLCNSHPRGLPFIASVPNEDRKDGPPLFRRLLRMRADRTRELTEDIVRKLGGQGGGFFALRLKREDKGRGVEGEALGEDAHAPEKGWAEIRWLEEASPAWNGLERDMLKAGWEGFEGIYEGEPLPESMPTGALTDNLVQPASVADESIAAST